MFATTPRQLRRAKVDDRNGTHANTISVRLPFRAPYDVHTLLRFLGDRAIEGVETWDGQTYRRTLRLPQGTGVVALGPQPDHIACELRLDALADLQSALQRCRRLLDLDTDSVTIDDTLGADPYLAPLVARRRGLRSPGIVDGTEALVRAVVGQQVSVTGARTVLGRIAAAVGPALTEPADGLVRVFPSAAQLAEASDDVFPIPGARRDALREACRRIARDEIALDAGTDRDAVRRGLVAVPGIGPWTAEYVAMRALGDPDAFPATDLGVRKGLARLGVVTRPRQTAAITTAWSPWRAYATHHLWNHLGDD